MCELHSAKPGCRDSLGKEKKSDCTVYIDEAGDLGIGRGTRWFILTAVIVDKEDEVKIRKRMNAIKAKINAHEIHMRKINDYMRRAFVVRELRDLPFTFFNVVVETSKFDANKIPDALVGYNYACRRLLERVSEYLCDKGKKADVVLSSRGTSRDGELIEYITQKLLPYPHNTIASNAFGCISAKTAATWDMLQLADVCTTSVFLSFEVNGWGIRTPCFLKVLEPHLYAKDGMVDKYGIKYLVEEMRPVPGELEECWPCQIK